MTIFKAYDIRGIYPSELNEEIAYKIGRAFVVFLGCKEVMIGRDARKSSPSLFEALSKGITDQGANVVDIGLVSTPMLYYCADHSEAAIMITASHNPAMYDGFKLCRASDVPISGESGIKEIEELVEKDEFKDPEKKGSITKKDMMEKFIEHSKKYIKGIKPLKIVADAGNGMGGLTFSKLLPLTKCEFIPMYFEVDCTYPNHIANPLNFDTLKELQKKVVEEKADFGLALDGDADRVFFIDEKGEIIPADIMTALIGGKILHDYPGAEILYDVRSSKSVPEHIKKLGGKPVMCRVGHAFIKAHMRKDDAVFAGELSGHFYYKDSNFTECTFASTCYILRFLSESDKKISELVAPLKKYFQSGEINSEVEDKDGKLKELETKFSDAKKIFHLDGLSVEYDDWWFNVRKSNTEPKLRLNLEATSKDKMEEMRDKVLAIIRA